METSQASSTRVANSTGFREAGNINTPVSGTQQFKHGLRECRQRNVGIFDGGNSNSGSFNVGFQNTGFGNSGAGNTGFFNAGDSNTGFANAGNVNTGFFNGGDINTGGFNGGNVNTGLAARSPKQGANSGFGTSVPATRVGEQ
ncbi:hypothetical protein ABOD65_11150 [Mycobacterium tuberculosis]